MKRFQGLIELSDFFFIKAIGGRKTFYHSFVNFSKEEE